MLGCRPRSWPGRRAYRALARYCRRRGRAAVDADAGAPVAASCSRSKPRRRKPSTPRRRTAERTQWRESQVRRRGTANSELPVHRQSGLRPAQYPRRRRPRRYYRRAAIWATIAAARALPATFPARTATLFTCPSARRAHRLPSYRNPSLRRLSRFPSLRPRRGELELDLRRRTRVTEQKPLHVINPGRPQHGELFFGLDTLCRRENVEAAPERSDCVDDCGAFGALGQFADKRLVDLDLVE